MITVNTAELKETLTTVSKATATKSQIKACETVLCTVSQGQISLTAYDLDVSLATTIGAETMDSCKFCVEPKLLTAIMGKLSNKETTIDVTDSNMTLSSGRTTLSIPIISAEEFPELPIINAENSFTIVQEVFKSMINQTIFAVATNDIKPILKGELFEITDNNFSIVAIDGHRLAVRTEPIKANNCKCVIPATSLNIIQGMLTKGECKIGIDKKHAMFEIGDYTITTRLLEGEFHDYKKSIPASSTINVKGHTSDFKNALDRCLLLQESKIISPVRLNIGDNKINVDMQTQHGKLNDAVNVETNGNVTIGFKTKYLLDAIKCCGDDFEMELSNAVSPAIIKNDGLLMLVLPVKLKG